MAQLIVDLGDVPNDGTGDTIREGGDKINKNFAELYSSVSSLALAIAGVTVEPVNSSNPNLYSDPEYEYLNVGDTQAWGATSMSVVLTGGAKRLRSPSSGSPLAVIDASARMVPVSAFPNGKVSASVIIARKDVTTVGGLRFRLYALDDGGNQINWPDVSGSDEPGTAGYYGRNVRPGAISAPEELIIAREVTIPPTATKIGFFLRVESTATMDFSHLTLRNGADPHYRSPRLSLKTLADASANAISALNNANSASAAVNGIGSSNSNPSLYPDPELDGYNVGDNVVWQTSGGGNQNLAIVNSFGKRIRTIGSSTPVGIIDAVSRRIPASNFPNGTISVSIIVARKDATTLGTDLRFRLYAYDSAGVAINWPTTGMDEAGGGLIGRYMPTRAITSPEEIIIAKNVALPAGTASVGVGYRTDTTATMDFSHLTIRNGNDPHYIPQRVSAKTVNDNSSAIVAGDLREAASSNPNLYSDPEYEYLNVGDTQSWTGINMTVVSSKNAKRLRTPVYSGTAIGAVDSTLRAISVANLQSGKISASVILARKDVTTNSSDIRFRLVARDSGGNQLNWPDTVGNDLTGASNYWDRFTGTAAIATPKELIIAENVTLPVGTDTVLLMVRVETPGTSATVDFSHLTVRNGADPHYRAPRVSAKSVSDAVAAAAVGPQALTYAEKFSVGQGLINTQPNLFSTSQLDMLDTSVNSKSANMTVAVATVNGVPGLGFTSPSTSTNWAAWSFNRAAVLSGASAVSCSFSVLSLDSNSSGSCRVLVRQMNGASEITAVRTTLQVVSDGSGVSGPKRFSVENIALDSSCTDIQFYIEVQAGSSGARTLVIRDMLLAGGGSAGFRRPPLTAASLGIISGDPEDFPDVAAQLPNRFTADELDVKAFRNLGGTASSLSVSTYGTDKRPAWNLTQVVGGTGSGVFFGGISRADLDNGSGVFSAAIQIYSFDAVVGGSTSQTGRILIIQRDSTSTEIAGTRVTFTLPSTGVATPQWFRQAGIALHANTTTVWMYADITNSTGTNIRNLKFGDFLLAAGSNAKFRRPPSASIASGSGGGVIYVGPSGSDSNSGSLQAPMATAQAAINKLGGYGLVIFLYGSYTQSQRISPNTITGKLVLLGRRSTGTTEYDNYPVIYCANRLTGITKTSSYTKVHQVALGSTRPTLANFNWAYQDGVPDPRTAIPVGEDQPWHRGRSYRLHWATKLLKTSATTLAEALTEIDGSDNNNPLAFIDDSTGIMYFSIVGGGDATTAAIYLDNTQGLFSSSGSTREAHGELEIMGLEVRYGGVDTSFFRKAHVDELFVFGAASNALYYSVLSYGTLECAAAGSQAGSVGDGLNGHNGAKITDGSDYYGHDCRDDGYSDHEGSSSRMHGGYLEFNGGTGMAPAYGADDVISNFISYKNQQRGLHKKAGFYVTGTPAAGASGGDGGRVSIARFKNCTSIGDICGFADDGASTSNQVLAICDECEVLDQTGDYGYDVYKMMNCRWDSAVGTARRVGRTTIVRNSAIVT